MGGGRVVLSFERSMLYRCDVAAAAAASDARPSLISAVHCKVENRAWLPTSVSLVKMAVVMERRLPLICTCLI